MAISARERRWVWVFAAVGLAVMTGAADWAQDLVFQPWALAEPPLLDRWTGRLVTAHGTAFDVDVALRRAEVQFNGDGRCARCSQIEGTAALCRPGDVRKYDLSGSPRDRHARRLHLGATAASSPPPEGLELDTLDGSWDGADTLELEADFSWREHGSSISDSDDGATRPVLVRLRRGGAVGCPSSAATGGGGR